MSARLEPKRVLAASVVAAVAALYLAGAALAVAPTLTAVSVNDRHPSAMFQAPRVSDAIIYLASKPDRATDGSFLAENVRDADVLTDSEIQAGSWLGETQVDPGTYYVMLHASPDFDSCYIVGTGKFDPACADGYSNVLTLVVKKPIVRYTASVKAYRNLREATLRLRAKPLGEKVAYRVCYRSRVGKRRCLRGTLDGYSWNASAEDELTVNTRGLRAVTTFTWFVGGKPVASKRATLR